MALNAPATLPPPRWPIEPLDGSRVWVDHDAVADELRVFFGGQPVPSYVDPIESPGRDFVSVLVDLNDDDTGSGEIVGLQLSPLLAGAVAERPSWRALAAPRPSAEAVAAFLIDAEHLFARSGGAAR